MLLKQWKMVCTFFASRCRVRSGHQGQGRAWHGSTSHFACPIGKKMLTSRPYNMYLIAAMGGNFSVGPKVAEDVQDYRFLIPISPSTVSGSFDDPRWFGCRTGPRSYSGSSLFEESLAPRPPRSTRASTYRQCP